MAESALLGLARSVVGGVLSKVSSAAAADASQLLGVRKEIWFIKDELVMIQAFLLAADAAQEKKPVVKAWVKQVKDLAYDIQDCLEEFTVHVERKSLSRQMTKLGARHQIAVDIRDLKARVEEVSKRNLRYNLIKISEDTFNSEDTARTVELTRLLSPLNIEESQLVGMEGPKKEVLRLITEADEALRVITIVGMGGLGKTTLAKKVYDNTDLSGHFTCRAWVTVSQSFDPTYLLKDLLRQLVEDQFYKELEEKGSLAQLQQVAKHIKDALKEKRYLLVLDDLWTTTSWDCIIPVLSENNNKGSRVIVTTRDADLANHCSSSPSLVYKLKTLSYDDSLELLLKKIRKSREDLKKCKELKEHSNEIVKKCGRLPLAIVTIGGLLRTKPFEDWEKLYNRLPSELTANPSLEAIKRVVTLSYNHLPYYLKPCLLYLSIFPEDFEIQKTCLVNRWIAEGFIREENGLTTEEVAEDYLYQLISRSMIQPSKSNLHGEVKSIQLHDIILDVILVISQEENLVLSMKEDNTAASAENFRHLAFHLGENLSCPQGVDLRRVRSLTVFNTPVEPLSSLCSLRWRMLRVLALENVEFWITQEDLSNIGSLCHLRYLSVYNSYIYALPPSLGNLQDLQILDIRKTYIDRLPAEISRFHRLRTLLCGTRDILLRMAPGCCIPCIHSMMIPMCIPCFRWMIGLRGCIRHRMHIPVVDHEVRTRVRARAMAEVREALSPRRHFRHAVEVAKNIGSLRHLQRLETLDIQASGDMVIKELRKLRQLRKLKVSGITNKYWMKFCYVLRNLSSLRSLHMNKEEGDEEHIQSHSNVSPPPLLESLKFEGHLRILPTWVTRLDKLCKIKLTGTKLIEGEVIKILKGSPNLVSLHLFDYSYVGSELAFRDGTFAKLKILEIDTIAELVGITFGEEVLPQLEKISVNWCYLESGISGVKYLPELKKIIFRGCSGVRALDMLEMELANHPNNPHPMLQMERGRSFHDLGPKEDIPTERTDS